MTTSYSKRTPVPKHSFDIGMSKIATVGLIVVFAACFGMLLYMTVSFLKDAAEVSVGTATECEPLHSQDFAEVVVCIGGWEPPNLDPKEHFLLGYLGRHQTTFSKLFRKDEEMFNRYLEQNRQYLDSEETFNRRLSNLMGPVRNLQSRKIDIVASFLTRRHCFTVTGNGSKTEAMDTYAARSGHLMFGAYVPVGKQEVSVSLYAPNRIDQLSDQHFTHIQVEDENATKLVVELDAKAVRHEYLKDHEYGCTEAPINGTALRLPVNHLEESCNMDCVYEAGEAAFNCTALPVYLKGRRVAPPCHSIMLQALQYSRDAYQLYREVFEACKERLSCATKRSCEQWELELKQTKLPKMTKMKKTQGDGVEELKIELKISFESKMTISRQFRLHSWSSIVGNVGGLIGIWLGFSVFGLCEMLFSAASKRKQAMSDIS